MKLTDDLRPMGIGDILDTTLQALSRTIPHVRLIYSRWYRYVPFALHGGLPGCPRRQLLRRSSEPGRAWRGPLSASTMRESK